MTDTKGKNLVLGTLSIATYYATGMSTTKKNRLVYESIMFGVINGTMQEFVPKLIADKQLQLLLVDPVIASIINAGIKSFMGYSVGQELSRGIVAGTSASAFTNYLYFSSK